jgi:hypothetical protein
MLNAGNYHGLWNVAIILKPNQFVSGKYFLSSNNK